MKKILVIGIILLSVFLIYLSTVDTKIYYLVLGNNKNFDIVENVENYSLNIKRYLEKGNVLEKHVENFVENDDRIVDLINDINNNKEIYVDNKRITIKNALIKSDIITLSIGINELQSKILLDNNTKSDIYKYIDELMSDYKRLFELIRQFCKENIILIGYYSSDGKYNEYLEYFNTKLNKLCEDYSIDYIDTLENNDIVTQIINLIEEKVLH